MKSSRPEPMRDEFESKQAPANLHGKIALALGVIAIALSLVLGYFYLSSVRRLEREIARLGDQTASLSRSVARAQQQSQTFAQQASQAAANAQAAAEQRDLAKQNQANSEAEAELARQKAAAEQQRAEQAAQQAAAEQQRATEAAQKAEAYRKQREADLAQLQDALGQIAETHRTAMGVMMTLDSKSIRFDFNQAEIKPEYRDILNRIAGILMVLKGYTIVVYGYTDDVGSREYNLQLSKRRAEAVRDFLVQAGISPDILSVKGLGASDPRVQGNTEEARAANRRVEISIVDSRLVTNGPLVVPN